MPKTTTLYEHPGAGVGVNDNGETLDDGLSSDPGLRAQRVEDYGRDGNLEMFELQTLSKPRPSDKVVADLDNDNDDDDYNESENSFINPTFTLFTPDEEAAVLKKFDRRLVLFIALLYMLSFLDRSNVGNAKIAGLSDDLNLTSAQYEWLLGAFYITYILFEWMALLYRVIPAHIYIAICVFSWGLIASLQSVVSNFASLVLLRALLGIGEAAFSPGVPFYLSLFYRRDELAFRTGLFISAAPLATSFASSLAWLITKASANTPIAPWRMLFLFEGFPSIIVAVIAWRQIPDCPSTARYLTPRQQEVASLRLQTEKTPMEDADEEKLGIIWGEVWSTLKDPKCYLTAGMLLCCNVAFSSLPVFLPTIIKEMGNSALTSQALSAPPYLLSFLIVLLTAHLSDHHRSRSPYIIIHSLLACTGYLLLTISASLQLSSTWRYMAIFPASAGFFSAVTIIITWTINNQPTGTRRAGGVVMLGFLGQLGPLIGVRLYPDEEGPYYTKGMAICAAFMAAVAGLAWGLRVYLRRKNAEGFVEVEDDEEGLVEGKRKRGGGRFVFIL